MWHQWQHNKSATASPEKSTCEEKNRIQDLEAYLIHQEGYPLFVFSYPKASQPVKLSSVSLKIIDQCNGEFLCS
jgi:hypothetical protein